MKPVQFKADDLLYDERVEPPMTWRQKLVLGLLLICLLFLGHMCGSMKAAREAERRAALEQQCRADPAACAEQLHQARKDSEGKIHWAWLLLFL